MVAATGVILAALYLLWAYQRVFHGEPDEDNKAFPELRLSEGLVLAPLLALIIFLGLSPKPFLDRVQPAVERLVHHVEENSDFREPKVATKGGEIVPASERRADEHGGAAADSPSGSADEPSEGGA